MASVEVCDDGYKDHPVLQALPFEHPQRNVLHEGVDTNYDVWLVLLQSSLHLPSSTNKKPFRKKREYKHRYIWRAIRSWYYKNEIIIYKERGTILKAHMLS